MKKREMIRDTPSAPEASLDTQCSRTDCPYHQRSCSRASTLEIIGGMVCLLIIAAVLIPCAYIADHWLEARGQQITDRLLWREPIERW